MDDLLARALDTPLEKISFQLESCGRLFEKWRHRAFPPSFLFYFPFFPLAALDRSLVVVSMAYLAGPGRGF